MGSRSLWSQPSAGSGSGSGSETPQIREGAEEDELPASGTGSALIAPADPAARLAWLQSRFAAVVNAKFAPRTKVSYVVFDLATNKELLARSADTGMNLASNTKLLTSIAALHGLGGGYRWRTAAFGNRID